MSPLNLQRALWGPLVVVLFSWALAGTGFCQDEPPASQPAPSAEPSAQTNQPKSEKPASVSEGKPASQPVVQPVTPATSPATQRARTQYRRMQRAAARNGVQPTSQTTGPTTGESPAPARELDEPTAPGDGSEETRRRIRAQALELRRQREAAREAEGAAPDQSEPATQPAEETEAQPEDEQEPVREARPAVRPGSRADRESARRRPGARQESPEVEVEPPASADGRDYFISFVDMPWEDVIAHYAKLVGKPLMGDTDAFIGGDLTYESERRFTREEMRDELNFLLLEQGYFIIEKEDYVYLVPTSELSKELPLDHVFDSLELFQQANLRGLEICSVLIQIEGRDAEEVRDMLSPSMPDRALPVTIGETNKIKITGLAQDVRRFTALLDIVDTQKFDPRETRFIKVETNVSEIERMLRDYIGAKPPTRRYDREQRRFVTEGGDDKLLIIADERTKNLIVKATPEELKEIEDFIKLIDEKPDIGEFKTTVIPVQYGSASDISRLLNDILQQEQGEQRRTPYRPPTRTTRSSRDRTPRATPQQAQTAAPEDIIVEDIYERAKKTVRIVADERTNNLVVYANEDGLKRVQEILEQIDQPVPANFRTFTLQFAQAEQIQGTIEQIVRGMAGTSGRGGRSSPTIVADGNLLHVVAEREDMTRIEEIIKSLDVEGAEDQWHFVELRNITASDAARYAAPFLDGSTGPMSGRRAGSRGRGPARTSPTAKTIPLDQANTLIVICSDEEWEKVEQVIKLADENAVSDRPEVKFVAVENGNVQSIANTVAQLYRSYQHPVLGRSSCFVDTLGEQIVVQGVKPALEEIEALVKSLDIVPDDNPLIILPLENADASQVAEIAQGLLPQERGRPIAGANLQAEPVTNSLIIQADKLTVERVKAFAAEMEEKVSAQQPERRYYTLKNAETRDVVTAINSLFGGTGGSFRGRGRGGPIGDQIKTVIVGNQVVVDAPASKQLEIAALVEQLDSLADQGITTLLVKMPGADIRSIAGRLSNAFIDRVRKQGVVARFEPDASTESILITVSKDVLEEAEGLLNQYKELTSEHVWQTEFHQLKHASATDASGWLLDQLVALVTQQIGSTAARQIKVTGDQRTNRIIINAPQVAVKQGLLLLEQYDQPAVEQPQTPMEIWTVELQGLDVRNLANNLQRALNEIAKERTDRLRANVSADQLTNSLIIAAPHDMKPRIDELIAEFAAKTADLTPVQKFVQIQNADANYIANQLSNILNQRITRLRGSSVAQQVSIQPETRLNKIVLNAPVFAVEMAEALIAELDQPPTAESQLQTIPLVNADANTIYSVLRTVFSGKMRAGTLSISVEPLTNSLIVGAMKEDFEQIKQWAEELDAKAVDAVTEPVIIEFKNANPWEVYNVLNATFVQRGAGKRVQPGKEIKISIVAGRSIVVQAPPEKLEEIQELAARLDEIGQDRMTVSKYKLPGMGVELNGLARDIQNAVNAKIPGREQRINVSAVPSADTLIVYATEKYLPDVEKAMEQFKDLYTPPVIETITLQHADANMVYQALTRVLQNQIRAGKCQLGVEPMTNALVASAAQEDMTEIVKWATEFDTAAAEKVTEPRIFELQNANPWEILSVLNTTFLQKRVGGRVQPGKEIKFSIVAGRSIVVQAPTEKMTEIADLIAKLDEIGANKAQVRTYELVGMGNRLNDLARQLADAVNRQLKGARDDRITVTAYPPADALIVTALEEQFELVEQMMEQLKPLMEVAKAKTEFFKLEYVDAAQIVGTVQNLVQTKARVDGKSSRGAQDFTVMADPRTNRLIVFAAESILPDVREIVAELDIDTEDVDVFTIELEFADPWETRNMINDIFNRGARGPRSAGQEIYVTVSNNTLVVKAPPKALEQIQSLLTEVDKEDVSGLQIKTYELKVLNAQQVAGQVQMFLTSIGGNIKKGQMRPGAFAEPTTNTLVVIAPAKHLPFIETLLAEIESKGEGEKAMPEAYVLKNARADQVQRHVDQMLQAKVAEREGATRGRTTQQKTAVLADPETNRLFVLAPPEYQELAREMIRMIDEEIDTGEIVHIIPLENGDAAQVAQTVTQTLQGAGTRGRGTAPPKVKVVPDAGSNSIILAGLPKDVAEIEDLVKELESASDSIPEIQYFTLNYAMAYEVAEALRGIFPVGRSVTDAVTVTEDEFYNKVLVTANKRKMRQVEKVIEQLDLEPPLEETDTLSGGKQLYFVEIFRGDAYDIAWEVGEFFPPEDRGGPRIEADWFGEYITVICRPGEYEKIERLIRQFEKRAKVEMVIRARDFLGGNAQLNRLRQYLDTRLIDNVDYVEPPSGIEQTESIIIDLHPKEEDERAEVSKPRTQAMPGSGAPGTFGGVVLAMLQESPDEPQDEPAQPEPGSDSPVALDDDGATPELSRERTSIQLLPDGRLMIRGPEDSVEEIEEAIDLFEEDLSRGEVIRIFRFRYGDVNAASRILDMMFNERQLRIPQQRQPQQPQQRGQRGGRQGQGEGEQQQQQQGGLMAQIQQMMGARGGQDGGTSGASSRIRIATDASHNYLIVKCDESRLPDIIQLLRELDIPPANVDVKVIQLKNLEATETANNIKEVLGITEARSARQASRRPPSGNPQQQLMEILQQQMVSVAGAEGSAKIESVEIVPNSITNSLLVSAPPDVMKLIEDVIDKMENLEGGDITVIKHFALKQAKVDDVLPLLQELFGAAGGGARGGRAGRGPSPSELGPVTISGDPRNNTIIYVAQAKDVETVEAQIEKLDIAGAVAEVEMYICKYGDAVGIAEVVSEMFLENGGGGRRAPRSGMPQSPNLDIRITAEPATNTVLVFAPVEKRELILEQVEILDRENRFDIREIPVAFAKPDSVADKLIQIFGGAGGSALDAAVGGRRGGARRQATQTQGRIVVIPDENAKKLLVRAPDEIFVKMQQLVEDVLDVRSEQLQIRQFTLKHADAEVVVDSVKSAMMEFMALQRQLGGSQAEFDAFTAVADPRTNSVIVVGSEETFVFVQDVIAAVDGDIPEEQQKQFRVFVLDNVPAESVADAINSFATGSSAAAGGRSAGRRGMMSGGMSTGAILDVQAIAEPSSNAVLVYGRGDDIEVIETMVIQKMDGVMQDYFQFATMTVKKTTPTQLVSFIQPFLDQTGPQADVRGGRGSGEARPGLQILPNDNNNTITVYGSARQIAHVEELVARFDTEDTGTNQFELIPVPWGQDATALAQQVEALVNDSEQMLAERQGRAPRLITVQANPETNVIMVAGDPAQYAVVKTVVKQLEEIDVYKPVTRIIELTNLSSQEAAGFISELQQQRRGSSSSGTRGSSIRRSTPSSGFRRSTPSRGSSTPRRSSGRRGWNWQPPQPNAERYSAAPAGLGAPLVGTLCLSPPVLWLQTAAQSDPQVEESPAEPLAETQPVSPLSSITGQLKGEVMAQALDARRIVVTGDSDDVEFIVQMLALMEERTPATEIRVFKLGQAKAAALAPMLEQAVQAYIETLSDTVDRVDRVSIIAEARGNSIIVTASEVNMTMIEQMIKELDFDAIADTKSEVVPIKHMQASEAAALVSEAWAELEKIRETPSNAQAFIRADDRSNSLMVVGTASDIADIRRLVEGIDVELGEDEEAERFDWAVSRVVVVELKNAVAESLAETLNSLIEVERSSGGGQGARGRAAATAQIRKLLLTTADGRELPPLDLDRPIRILPEKGKNALVIFSTPKNNEALVEIAGLFDELPGGAEVEVKSFALEHGNAEEIADLLQTLFDDAKKALKRPAEGDSGSMEKGVMPPIPPGLAGRGLPYNVVVSHDVRSNTVFVVGRKDAVLLAAGLITEMDRPSADLNMKAYVLQLRKVNVQTVQETLDELFDERAKALGVDKNEARDSAVIKADDRSNQLLVVATPEIYAMVSDLAAQLDGAEPYSIVDGQFRRLTYADAAKLAGLLQEYFDKKKDADNEVTESGQKNVLHVFSDARSNSLMMAGTRDYLDEANQLIENLDQAFDPTVQFKLHPVRLNSAANIATLLEDMIEQSRRDQSQQMQGTPIHVAADPYSNSLLLAASAEDMLMLERWIEVLDRPSEPGRITRIIPLKRGDAQELAQSAQDLFQTKASGADADVTVTHDVTTNSVIAIGPPAVVADIEDFVNQLNEAEGSGAVVRIFKLEQADAEDAGELLRSILEGRAGSVGGGSRSSGSRQEDLAQVMLVFQRAHPEFGMETLKALRSEIVVIDDLRTNSLVVTAPPESMPLMESLVSAIDVPPDAAKIRVFKLRNHDAAKMVEMLEALFEAQQTGSRSSGTDQQERILTLGEGFVEGGRQMVQFTVDTRTNSVIAAGTTGYLDQVEELIVELDGQEIEVRKTLVYEPRNNPAMDIEAVLADHNENEQRLLDQLAEDLSPAERMRREILSVASEETNRLVLSYDPRRESEVLELVHDLDQPPPQVMIQVLIVEVTMDNSLDLGVEFAFQDLQYTKAGPTDTTTFDFVGGTDIGAAGSGLGGFTFTITGADFNFLFRTLQNEGILNILSRPQIMAMDNQEARIEITDDVPYVSSTSTSTAGQITTSVARQDVGIILEVTPHINPDGYVRMEIRQEVSDITGSTIDVGQGVTAPVFFKREAETVVTVKDNETVVLGGLIESSDEEREQKVPLLGDVPILGWLARNQSKQTRRTELLVILTPRVIRSVEDFRELSVQERDRTGELPDEVLTNELMNRLRVAAEDLKPAAGEDMLGPFPESPKPAEEPEEYDPEIYGPVPSSSSREDEQPETLDPDSYDIPVTWARSDVHLSDRMKQGP